MRRWWVLALLGLALASYAADEKPARKGGSRQPVQTSKCNDVPARPFDLILARPTANSVTVSVLCYEDAEGVIAFGTQPSKLTNTTSKRAFRKGEPAEIVLSGLDADSQYFYQLRLARTNSAEFSFHTAPAPRRPFTFTVTSDSHLDEHTDPVVYQSTLANALADKSDFQIELGDTFMTEKHPNREAAFKQYFAQRYYFGQLCHSAPFFYVLGNHDGESPRGRGNETDILRRLVEPDAEALLPESRSRQFLHWQRHGASRCRAAGGLLCMDLGRRLVRGA